MLWWTGAVGTSIAGPGGSRPGEPPTPAPARAPPNARLPRSLCVQVRPSQPSRQIQEKESPLPTQVPPFMQGLDRQLLFLAVRGTEEEGGLFIWPWTNGRPHQAPTQPEAERAGSRGGPACLRGRARAGAPGTRLLTNVAGAALPAGRTGTAEGVAAVVARATVAAGIGVTLELACGHTGGSAGEPPSREPGPAGRGRAGTHVSGRSCPSSHRHTRSRSR